MKYICDSCGYVLDETEIPTYRDDFGYETELGHYSAIKEFSKKCLCGGNFEEATECKICGQPFANVELGGICNECLEDAANFETALEVGADNKDLVEINSYLLYEFEASEIEEILKRELLNAEKFGYKNRAKDYLLQDTYYFANWLKKAMEGDNQ